MQSRQDAAAAAWGVAAASATKPKPTPVRSKSPARVETQEEIQRRIQEEDDRIMMTRMGKGGKGKPRVNNDASDAWAAAYKADNQRKAERAGEQAPSPQEYKQKESHSSVSNRSHDGMGLQGHPHVQDSSPWATAHVYEQTRQAERERALDGATGARPMSDARKQQGTQYHTHTMPKSRQPQEYPEPPGRSLESFTNKPSAGNHEGACSNAKIDALKEQYRKFAGDRAMEQRKRCMAIVEDNEVFDWIYRLLSESQETSIRSLQQQISFLQTSLNLSREQIDSFLTLIDYEKNVQ